MEGKWKRAGWGDEDEGEGTAGFSCWGWGDVAGGFSKDAVQMHAPKSNPACLRSGSSRASIHHLDLYITIYFIFLKHYCFY